METNTILKIAMNILGWVLIAGTIVLPICLIIRYMGKSADANTREYLARQREREETKENYYKLTPNMTYMECRHILNLDGILLEQCVLPNNTLKQVYTWYYGWHIVGLSSGNISATTHYSNSSGSGHTNGSMSSEQKERTSILLVFENDKLVSKKQKGLF